MHVVSFFLFWMCLLITWCHFWGIDTQVPATGNRILKTCKTVLSSLITHGVTIWLPLTFIHHHEENLWINLLKTKDTVLQRCPTKLRTPELLVALVCLNKYFTTILSWIISQEARFFKCRPSMGISISTGIPMAMLLWLRILVSQFSIFLWDTTSPGLSSEWNLGPGWKYWLYLFSSS